MTEYCGKDLLVQLGNGDGPPETFDTIGSMRANTLTINNESVDVTTKSNMTWRQLLGGCGVQSMTISGEGVLTDDTDLEAIEALANANTVSNYKMVSGRGDYYIAAFQITSFERTGEYNGAETFSVTFESAGDVAYTAPV